VVIVFVVIFQNDWLISFILRIFRRVQVKQEEVLGVPMSAGDHVGFVLLDVPNVLALEVRTVGQHDRPRFDRCNVQAIEAAKGELSVVVDPTNGPYAANILQLGGALDLRSVKVSREIRVIANDEHVAVTHADGDVDAVVEQTHTVHAFRSLQGLEQVKVKLVVNKNAAVSAADEDFVKSHNTAVHLATLDVERLDRVRLIKRVDVDVIILAVCQKERLPDCKNVPHTTFTYTINISRRITFFVQVFKCPHFLQVICPNDFIRIHREFLNDLHRVVTQVCVVVLRPRANQSQSSGRLTG